MKKSGTFRLNQLAPLYFPERSAEAGERQLRRWIKRDRVLQQELAERGYVAGQHVLTPRQCEVLFAHFGYPGEEEEV